MRRELQLYFPLGYPVGLASDSEAAHAAAAESWPSREQLVSDAPIAVSIRVTPGGSIPPRTVTFGGHAGGFRFAADGNNVAEGNFESRSASVQVDEAVVQDRAYFRFQFLEAAVLQLISGLYHAPIHAACVTPPGTREQNGVLLCGDSGAGKSSLAYACARAGWTFTSDDASFLIRGAVRPTVVADAHRIRIRPETVVMFPEVAAWPATERGNGDKRLQLATNNLRIKTASQTGIEQVVLLNRVLSSPARSGPWDRVEASDWLNRVVYDWAPAIAAVQRTALENLLRQARLRILTYSRLEDAIEELRR